MKNTHTFNQNFRTRIHYIITINYIISVVCLVLLTFSCSNDSPDDLLDNVNEDEQNDDPNNDDPVSTINYTDDIRPIMQSSCVGCHGNPPTNGAPFSLISFSQVSQRSAGILNAMSRQSGTPGAMPPSGRLPRATINLIQEWIDNDMPEN